jgi:hypothetical protein
MPHAFERVTAEQAADRIGRASGTIHSWGTRFGARKIRVRGSRAVFYDYNDLMVIEREIYHGHPIPATWQERAEIRERCPLKTAETFPAAA